jgi:hypothetical protein
MKEQLAEVIGTERAATLIALTLLLRAVSKQPGIDRELLIKDLIDLLPAESQGQHQDLLKAWREVLETNF